MKKVRSFRDPLSAQLKQLVADLFRLDIAAPSEIPDDEPLLGSGLGLDSLDALELAMCIEEEFGVVIQTQEDAHRAFASIASLVDYISARTKSSPVLSRRPAAA